MTLHEAVHALQRLLDLLVGGGVRTPDKALAAFAKSAPRNHDNSLFLKQPLRERLVVHATGRHRWEGVESAARLEGGQPQFVQPAHDELAPPVPGIGTLRFPLMSGDIYVDRKDASKFWQVLQFGIQNLYDPEQDEWIRIDKISDEPGKVTLPKECAAAAALPNSAP